MNAIELLLSRQSDPLLTEPAPNEDDLKTILTAGMRVPDHAALAPFHFTVVQEQALQTLSDIYVEAAKKQGVDQAKLEKTAKMPFRAPLIIVVSTRYQQHDKVPAKEQLITAGCCTHAMQMAAFALGYGAMWRTGDLAFNHDVKLALNIDEKDDIAGFLYIGTKAKTLPTKPERFFEDNVTYL